MTFPEFHSLTAKDRAKELLKNRDKIEPKVFNAAVRLVRRDLEIEEKENARSNLKSFISYCNKNYIPAPFHEYMCERLTKFVHGEIKRLIFVLPPGRGKSLHTSIYTPSYALGENPEHKIITTSYGADLASSFNREVQRVMLSEEYMALYPKSALGQKNIRTIENEPLRNSDIFEINGTSGYYKSAGVGGAITGRRFSLGFVDDFVKGFEEANSPVYREKVWNWFRTDFMSRQLPAAGICVTATRWHPEDLIGMLLKLSETDKDADQWELIHFPEIIETASDIHEYDKREIGDLLWESRYDQKAYLATKATYDTYQFNALYQGRPTAREGNVFKRSWYLQQNGSAWQIPFLNGQLKQAVAYWDLAYSDNPKADRTVGSLMLSDASNYEWVQDVNAFRLSIADRNRDILRTCIKWNELFPRIKVYLESGMGAGVQDVQELQRLLIADGINVTIDNVRDSKVVRATKETGSFMSASQNGMIRFCEGAWNEDALLELSRLIYKETNSGMEFTGGHDDILDSLVGCHRKLTKHYEPFNITIIEDIEEWVE